MMENEDRNTAERLNPGRVAAAFMIVVGALIAVVATVWTPIRFWELSQAETSVPVSQFVLVAAHLFLGWGLGLLLWGAAEILRKLDEQAESARLSAEAIPVADPTTIGAPQKPASDSGSDQQMRLLEELIRVTRELRDIELLSEPERAARVQAEADAAAHALERDIPALLRQHNWHEARQRIARARQRFPSLPNWAALDEQVEQMRQKFETRDVEAASREIEDLISLGAWNRAATVLRDLQQRHPDSQKAAELRRRILAEQNKSAAQERARLMSQAQEASNGHDWRAAIQLVETVLEKYPDSPEANELRVQLPTLRNNVEIQIRQGMETQIRELIQQQRYAKALTAARELIERYPASPQAGVLRDQLPRLEEKAAERR